MRGLITYDDCISEALSTGRYRVDEQGGVRRLVSRGKQRGEWEVVGTPTREGYLVVQDAPGVMLLVHRIVYSARVGKLEPGCDVRHSNGVKDDNQPGNLVLKKRACLSPMQVRRRNQAHVFSLKHNKSCMDCGIAYPSWVMQFDHRPGSRKTYNVGWLASSCSAITTIDREVAKCDLVCANCHAGRTHRRRVVVQERK